MFSAQNYRYCIFVVWVRFVLLLIHFCVCLSCVGVMSGLASCFVVLFLVLCFFCQNMPEHDVVGNFPATRSTNHECLRPLVPALPRSVSIVLQCTHLHPSAPIWTHLHPLICLFISVPIRTHLHASEYRYLFEKSKKIDKLIKIYQFNISNMINTYVSDLCILVLDPRKFY